MQLDSRISTTEQPVFFYRSRSVNLQIEIFAGAGDQICKFCSENPHNVIKSVQKTLTNHKITENFRLRRASRSTKQKYNSKSGFPKIHKKLIRCRLPILALRFVRDPVAGSSIHRCLYWLGSAEKVPVARQRSGSLLTEASAPNDRWRRSDDRRGGGRDRRRGGTTTPRAESWEETGSIISERMDTLFQAYTDTRKVPVTVLSGFLGLFVLSFSICCCQEC